MTLRHFVLTENHIILLNRMWVGWGDCEFGAPRIDPKRPYGNSDVRQDMLQILGLKELRAGVYEFALHGRTWLLKGEDQYNIYLEGADERDLIDTLDALHRETEIALQVCLSSQSFTPGCYTETSPYSSQY